MTYSTIQYLKEDNDTNVKTRKIVPISIPKDYITAFDVSDLDDDEIERLQKLYHDYQDYIKLFNRNMFTFDKWAEHIQESVPDLKYRNFKLDKIKYV